MTTKTLNIELAKNTKQAKIISPNALYDLLVAETKSNVINIVYFVDESKSKQVRGAKQVQKRVQIKNLYLNHNYANKVNNLIEKQGGKSTFVAQELKGKERISSTIIMSKSVKNYGKMMLDGKILKEETRHLLGYFHEGKQIELNKSKPGFGRTDLVSPSFYQAKQYTSGRGFVNEENDFNMITVFLDNIEMIKFNKRWYIIRRNY